MTIVMFKEKIILKRPIEPLPFALNNTITLINGQ